MQIITFMCVIILNLLFNVSKAKDIPVSELKLLSVYTLNFFAIYFLVGEMSIVIYQIYLEYSKLVMYNNKYIQYLVSYLQKESMCL